MRAAVVVGGTGMLARVVGSLAEDGWSVVVPSRRGWRGGQPTRGKVRSVRARWQEPEELADSVRSAVVAPVELVVAWIHTPHREPVLAGLAPLLSPRARVVEVWGSAGADPLDTLPPPILAGDRTDQVVLGYARSASGPRWLTNSEIADGVSTATERALDAHPARIHEVGTLRPWPPQ